MYQVVCINWPASCVHWYVFDGFGKLLAALIHIMRQRRDRRFVGSVGKCADAVGKRTDTRATIRLQVF